MHGLLLIDALRVSNSLNSLQSLLPTLGSCSTLLKVTELLCLLDVVKRIVIRSYPILSS
jgi:hypothetical protein